MHTDAHAALIAELNASLTPAGRRVRAATVLELLLTDRAARFIFWRAVDLVLFLQAQGVAVKPAATDNRYSAVLCRLLAAEGAALAARPIHNNPWGPHECAVSSLVRVLGDDPGRLVGEGQRAALAPRRVAVTAEVKPVAAD